MKQINLKDNLVALVDDEDFDRINQHNWCIYKKPNTCYAATGNAHKHTRWLMHELVLNICSRIDHKDGNGLNNQKSNLRLCTQSQNLANRGPTKVSKTGFKGVFPVSNGRFRAGIMKNGIKTNLGTFDLAVDAAKAYNKKAIELFGEFAKLNEGEGL